MSSIKIEFKFIDNNKRVLVDYKFIKCHLLFDVNM